LRVPKHERKGTRPLGKLPSWGAPKTRRAAEGGAPSDLFVGRQGWHFLQIPKSASASSVRRRPPRFPPFYTAPRGVCE
jgi:hypothetical protein